MKGKISKSRNNDIDRKKEEFETILPKDFDIVSISVNGKKIVANVREMLEIADCEDESAVKAAMNKAASNYFFFGRIVVDLEDALAEAQENFDLWLASKMDRIDEVDSEKGKERIVKSKYSKEYIEKKTVLRQLLHYNKQADIAKKALDRSMSMMQSVGAFLRKEKEKPDSHEIGNED